jgi:hypothetical protein
MTTVKRVQAAGHLPQASMSSTREAPLVNEACRGS